MNKNYVVKASGIHKTFYASTPVEVLKGISLEVEKGETIAIMGKSGEGKSTLLHILGTLETACKGELEICGISADSSSFNTLRNQHIGFIFQAYNLLDDYTTLDNVLMPAKIARKETHAKSAAYARALELLDKVGLSTRANFFTKLLSGGERQRAAIARALMNDPDLILADEPSGNLDRSNSASIHDLLIRTAKELNKSLIVVTHDLELASLCDRKFHLKNGQL